MGDTVKIEMSQFDEATGTRISYVYAEWVGSDRDTANVMSMSLANAVVGAVNSWRDIKGADPSQVVIDTNGKASYGENPNGLIKSR